MIQVNGLKIGNYLKDDTSDAIMQVSRIESTEYTDWNSGDEFSIICKKIGGENGYYEGDFQPIPLTEDVLLKCGFKICADTEWLSLNLCNDWTFIYANCNENIFELSVNRHGVMLSIKYLHQLQNIVHSLTQKELEVNI
jgi:regulation of enolase protein 1 (concanavalin A-like superfamily)